LRPRRDACVSRRAGLRRRHRPRRACHCAACQRRIASSRGSSLRISLHAYNDADDVDAALAEHRALLV
jgi:selenocysteine lyase/cysteine desulfurase